VNAQHRHDDLVAGGPHAGGSRWSAIAGLVGVVGGGVAFFVLIQAIGPDRLQSAVSATGPLAPIVYVLLKAITVVLTPISGSPLRLAAGVLFGFWEGVALSVLGGVLGGSFNFWIARRFGRPAVAGLLGASTLARVEPTLDRLGTWKKLVLARIVLAPLWDVLSYGVGLTRLRYRTYLAVAIVGDLIPTMILVGIGSSVMEVGVIETGTAGAQNAESMLPLAVTLILLGIAAAMVAVTVAVLRPRMARRLAVTESTASTPEPAAPDARPTIVPGSATQAPSQKGRSAA
jgi:uncharacterized membrane protein YdjX (TVP38/TMEM64 family)